MITLEMTSAHTMEHEARKAGIPLAIEQTEVWAKFQETIPGRSSWGAVLIRQTDDSADSASAGTLIGAIQLIAMDTHGFRYLLSEHGPAWKQYPGEAVEQETIRQLRHLVHEKDKSVAFLRICTFSEEQTRPVLSMLAYDKTVIIDLDGGKDAILSRMKQRGRYDVRKALRRSHAEITDETEQGIADFSPYYSIMVATAKRDHFTPAAEQYYSNMLRILGKKYSRLYVARTDGKPVAWFIATISGKDTVYYFGSSLASARKDRVPDKMMFQMACDFSDQGYATLDLMGIGSQSQPKLLSLNQFKTKFTKEVTDIAPMRDVPVRTGFYRLLVFAKNCRTGLRHLFHPHESEKEMAWYRNHAQKSSRQGKEQKAEREQKTAQQKTTMSTTAHNTAAQSGTVSSESDHSPCH